MSKEIQEAIERIKSIRQTISSWVFNDNTSDKVRENDLKDLQSIDLLLQDHEKQNNIIHQLKDAIVKYEKAEHYRVESDVVEYFKDTLNGKENNLF